MFIRFLFFVFIILCVSTCGITKAKVIEGDIFHWVSQKKCFVSEEVNKSINLSKDDLLLYFRNYWYRFTFKNCCNILNIEKIKIKDISENLLIISNELGKNHSVNSLKLTKQFEISDLVFCNSDLHKELLQINEFEFLEINMSNLDMTNIILSIINKEISIFKNYPYRIKSILVNSKEYINLVITQLKTDFSSAKNDLFMEIQQTKKNGKYLKIKVKRYCGVRCGGIVEHTLKKMGNDNWNVISTRNLTYY